MRLTILLFVLMLSGQILKAQQDTIRSLVITECRLHDTHRAYLEVTNMGDMPIQLNQFKIGSWGGGSTLVNGKTNDESYALFPDYILLPGKSYVLATADDYNPEMFKQGLRGYNEKTFQDNMWKVTNSFIHLPEANGGSPLDSITPKYSPFNEQWGGKNGFFIKQILPNGDSIVIDQVAGMFQGEGGANLDRTNTDAFDVAGITAATENSYLIRKFSVKQGNLDFAGARGVGLDDSEWIPIPFHGSAWRLAPWTVGNHGDNNFDDKTLVSDKIDVDVANKKLTIPWGVRRGDDIMSYFEPRSGIGWEYVLNPNPEDSLSLAAHTGDQLIIYVCGNDLDKVTFDIVVKDPSTSANMVVPVLNKDYGGYWKDQIDNGEIDWPRITNHSSGLDSIWGERGGIPYATRVDSLLERLDKPVNASWEIKYANGVIKPDLTNGDKLKVTAKNGSVKEYYISVLEYRANNDAYLSSITWPDIPEFYKGIFGWKGDTIPGFRPEIVNFNVEVPLFSEGIPSLLARKRDSKATVEVTRAKSLSGSASDRTVNFKVVAEDDTTIVNYNVVLRKEVSPDFIQPYQAEPFFSEVVQNFGWNGIDALEIGNPGNVPLDLSNYMIMGVNQDPAVGIANTNGTNYPMRYEKYIPGYKWAADEASWSVQPYMAQKDLSVNAIVNAGDVFAMGSVNGGSFTCYDEFTFRTELDVQFSNQVTDCDTWVNQWGELIAENGTPFTKWFNQGVYLFKITNDSIKKGLKPATDPNDFELLDVIGGTGTDWNLQGGEIPRGNPFGFVRKPEFTKGNPVSGASFSVAGQPDNVEWDPYDLDYWSAQGEGWPNVMNYIVRDLGKHYFIPPTEYMSTVGSKVYKISEGYSMQESIKGIKSGTTVAEFLNNIIKANEGQTLKVLNSIATPYTDGEVLKMNDILYVLSADSVNESQYVLSVTAEGFSSNALLSSADYKVEITKQPVGSEFGTGLIGEIPYGITIKAALENLTVPAGATVTFISGDGAYVPSKILNYDSIYVDVTVNTNIYLEVIAENGTTGIIYQLMPKSTQSDAFVTSNIFTVDQAMVLIELVPKGISTVNFLDNVIPSFGATIKVVDKLGNERVDGLLADDDRLIVTSGDKTKIVTYFVSTLDMSDLPGISKTYFAYIVSDEYTIDQAQYVVKIDPAGISVSQFLANVVPSVGANVKLFGSNGIEKTSGGVVMTDVVKVTSADSKLEVTYIFGGFNVGNKEISFGEQVLLYPNPTNGTINLLGVKQGQRVKVYNLLGSTVLQLLVQNSHEVISIVNQPAGIYMIVVSDEKQILGQYKAVKY